MSLATKYRPTDFNSVVGESQNITIDILKRQLETGHLKNAYLMSGKSGSGKTTCSRCLAKAINKGIGNPIEIDGATAGNVETIRAIVEEASTRATDGAEYKVIIIDECQMLGGGRKENCPAWTALLKCIEDCPKYTIFIFCSTDPEKIPEAIMNRLQIFNFAPISAKDIKGRLKYICEQEGFTNFDLAIDFISKRANGGMRDAISLLEKCADYSKDLSIDNVKKVLGGLSYETMFNLTWALQNKDEGKILSLIEGIYNNGQDLKVFLDNYLSFILDLEKFIIFKDISVTQIPEYLATENNAVVQFTTKAPDSQKYFNDLVDALLDIKLNIKYDTSSKSTIIALLLRFIRG